MPFRGTYLAGGAASRHDRYKVPAQPEIAEDPTAIVEPNVIAENVELAADGATQESPALGQSAPTINTAQPE